MNTIKAMNIQALLQDAETSAHKEAYKVLDRSQNYRIGVGARLPRSGPPVFFFEVVIRFCGASTEVDLHLLEKNLGLLQALHNRGYVLHCDDDGCISCEMNISPQHLLLEYETIQSTITTIFNVRE